MGAQRPAAASSLTPREVGRALGATELLGRVAVGALERLAASTSQRPITNGETLFRAGATADGVYVLVSGEVTITAGERVLQVLAPVTTFGDLAVLDGRPRSATARATSDGLVLLVSRTALLASMRSEPALVDALFSSLGTVLRRMTAEAAEHPFASG